jgi:Ca2+/Na+ antiporter
MNVFIEPETCNAYQLMFLTSVYGYFLFQGSSMISDGSELLLLVPSISGIVGSVVLPVLGAVPDSLMVLFSGLSDDPQSTVAVGVGALAGSTIMLLTLPWFLSVVGGQVPIDNNGCAVYSKQSPEPGNGKWSKMGVGNSDLVKRNGLFMIFSVALYLVIQVPVFMGEPETVVVSAATIGCVLCVICFLWYIVKQYREQNAVVDEIVTEARVSAIRTGELSLLGAMKGLFASAASQRSGAVALANPLLGPLENTKEEMRKTVAPFFKQYENLSSGKKIGKEEFRVILRDLNLGRLTETELDRIFSTADSDGSGHIDFDEFVDLMMTLVRDFEILVDVDRFYGMAGDESESDEIPDDLLNLTPEEQQSKIKKRAFYLMFFGTLLVLVFSDPAVEVMNEIAVRGNISPFYVSFILAPLASNASEVIASFNYAKRKTKKSIQVSLTTLEGAACLNNTFCLSIFLGIVAVRQLEWKFSAEVISIIFVELVIGFIVLSRRVFSVIDGLTIMALYPASLVLVAILKRITC